jgi:tRNA A-37 threonylcarbamoyl transferase component Bud32
VALPEGWIPGGQRRRYESGQAWVYEVVRADDPEGEKFAIKILKNTRRRERFAREVSVMVRLRDAGIAAIPEVVQSDLAAERPYFVMPWYEDGSLDKRVENGTYRSDPVSAVVVALSLAGAFHEIHGQGYAHRDGKPANALIAEDGTVHLADFGLCLEVDDALERLTETHEAIGSRFYLAPELESGLGEGYDHRPADFYSFGKVLWALIAGRQPPAREEHISPENRLAAVLDDPRLSRIEPLLEQLASVDPRERLADWNLVIAELETIRRALSGESEESAETDRDRFNAALRNARRLADLPAVSAVEKGRGAEQRRNQWLAELFGHMTAAMRATGGDQLEQLSAAGGERYSFQITAGGPNRSQLIGEQARLADLFHGSSSDMPHIGSAVPGQAAVLMFGSSPIGAPLPFLGLGLHVDLAEDGLRIVRVPYLTEFPGPAICHIPDALYEEVAGVVGPFPLFMEQTREGAYRFASDSANVFIAMAIRYLDTLAGGKDPLSDAAWRAALT